MQLEDLLEKFLILVVALRTHVQINNLRSRLVNWEIVSIISLVLFCLFNDELGLMTLINDAERKRFCNDRFGVNRTFFNLKE